MLPLPSPDLPRRVGCRRKRLTTARRSLPGWGDGEQGYTSRARPKGRSSKLNRVATVVQPPPRGTLRLICPFKKGKNWKGFEHEENSIGTSNCGHCRLHRLGGPISG